MNEKRAVYGFIAIAFAAMLVVAFTLNGTADSGDSVYHFLFAKYAFIHPENFYNVWAKPLYVLFASPFAQYGFVGIKVFNILNTIIAMIATYLVAKKLNMQHSWFVPVLLVIAPMNTALAFSGLTEPLFAAMLIGGLCLLFYEKTATGLIILSFLPFVRSEGMFMILIVAAYLLTRKKYKAVLWLATGQALYAVIGYFKFSSFMWFYEANPYAFISSYGRGSILTYFRYMPLIAGLASSVLLAVGVMVISFSLFKSISKLKQIEAKQWQMLLVLTLFSVYFMFHVIARKFGLFASLGIVRIIVGVAPLTALLCLYGFNSLLAFVIKKAGHAKMLTVCGFALVIVINIADFANRAYHTIGEPGCKFTLGTDQLAEKQMAEYIKQKYPGYKNEQILYNATYLMMALDVDPFGNNARMMRMDDGKLPDANFYIWDNWFSVVEGGITLETLAKYPTIVRDTSFSKTEQPGDERTVILFRKK